MTRRILPLLTLLAVLALALPAWAATTSFSFTGSDFLIPQPEGQAPVGELRLLATYDVVAAGNEAFIGTTCRFVVTAANGESVHQANFGRLVTNGSETDINGTESEANVSRTVLDDATLILGETVQLFNVIGPFAPGDTVREGFASTSVDYEVSATCSTTESTTTTLPPGTSSSVPTTTTVVPPSSTSTTDGSSSPPTTAPTPTAPPSTTVVVDEPPSTQIPPVTLTELPFTAGELDPAPLAMAAVALVALGGGLLVMGRAGRHEG